MNKEKLVLIVDDDDNMREAMKETVSRMGVSVDTAENGKIGYAKATEKRFDLIISDMRMPEIDGISMFEMLKATGITTPVCFVTAYGTVTGAVEALKIGAYDYILKPFSPEVIEELLRRTFELTEASPQSVTDNGDGKRGAVYSSKFMTHVFELAKDVAESRATVLITGESGTGKEVLARFIHENSDYKSGSFVAVNCAAIPENLLESELFGYEKGAFTGASGRKLGKFEAAEGGTILLDEVGEIPLHLQAKLLRVLQEKEVERLGGLKPAKINARILATTNRNLRTMADEGSFREDLYYRLNVINIELPPLRKRKEDVKNLAEFFVKKYSEINKKPLKPLGNDAMETLLNYEWPGNVRELEHTIERAVVLSKTEKISGRDLFLHGITVDDFQEQQENCQLVEDTKSSEMDKHEHMEMSVGMTIAHMERELILKTLKEVGDNRGKAAEILGITVRTLRNKLNEYKESGD